MMQKLASTHMYLYAYVLYLVIVLPLIKFPYFLELLYLPVFSIHNMYFHHAEFEKLTELTTLQYWNDFTLPSSCCWRHCYDCLSLPIQSNSSASDKIYLPSEPRVQPLSYRIGTNLPSQVDLNTRVNGRHTRILTNNGNIVGKFHISHFWKNFCHGY